MLSCHVLPCVAPSRPQSCRQRRNRRNTCRVLQEPASGAHDPVEHAAREVLKHVSETERDAAVDDLRSRLRGWPDQPCVVSDDQKHATAASVGISKRWFIDQATELEVDLTSSVRAEAHPLLRLRATLRTSSPADMDPGRSVKLSWELVPHSGSSDGSGSLILAPSSSSASSFTGTARLLPRAGTQGIAIRLRVGDGPAQSLLLPTVSGLLTQLAADAANNGRCVVRRQLQLGRGENTGSLLCIVRNEADGGVHLELYSDAPHALVLHWALLEKGAAASPGAHPTWSLPPPELRHNDCGGDDASCAQTPFVQFRASVEDSLPGEVGHPAIATLQRCCLSFNAAAAERWGGLAFVLRSTCGRFSWQNNFDSFTLPWAEEQCAVSWEDSPYLLDPGSASSWSRSRTPQ